MTEDNLLKAAERAVYESITKALINDYRGPLNEAVNSVIKKHQCKLEQLMESAYLAVLDSEGFKQEVKSALSDKVARTLVSKLGGEIESQVNALKADPATRARITLALTEIANGVK